MPSFDEITKPFDFASNMIQGSDVMIGWAKPQDSLKYNNHTFDISSEENSPQPYTYAQNTIPVLTIKTTGKGLVSKEGLITFCIWYRAFCTSTSRYTNGQVILRNFNGFYTTLGDQAEFDFSGIVVKDQGYLLTFNAQIFPFMYEKILEDSLLILTASSTAPVNIYSTPMMIKSLIDIYGDLKEILERKQNVYRISGAVLIDKEGKVTPAGSFNNSPINNVGAKDLPWAPKTGYMLDIK